MYYYFQNYINIYEVINKCIKSDRNKSVGLEVREGPKILRVYARRNKGE